MMVKHSLLIAIFAFGAVASVPASGCTGPALLVKVSGLKNRTAEVRIRAFGGDPARYFDRRAVSASLYRGPPADGPADFCLPVRPGVYAVDVRQDVDGDTKTGLADGVGVSGNPRLSLLDVLFKRRPPAGQVQVRVGSGVTVVPVTVRYRG